jgi:uncharacterized protein YjcR
MLLDMQRAKRCGAKTRRGTECQSPAMPNGRCRMHGGKSPGAPKGNRNAWKHGSYSVTAKAERFLVKRLLQGVSSLRKSLSQGET